MVKGSICGLLYNYSKGKENLQKKKATAILCWDLFAECEMIQNVWLNIPEECCDFSLPEGRRRCVHSVPMKAPDFPKQTSNISPEHLNAAIAPFPKPSSHPDPLLLLGGREERGFNLVPARWPVVVWQQLDGPPLCPLFGGARL